MAEVGTIPTRKRSVLRSSPTAPERERGGGSGHARPSTSEAPAALAPLPIRLVLLPASSGRARKLFAAGVEAPPTGAGLRVLLGPDVRAELPDDPDGPGLGVWPVADGPKNRVVFDDLRPGDLVAFVRSGRIPSLHRLVTTDVALDGGRLLGGGSARGPGLILSFVQKLDAHYMQLRDAWGGGGVRGPNGLMVLAGPRVPAVLEAIGCTSVRGAAAEGEIPGPGPTPLEDLPASPNPVAREFANERPATAQPPPVAESGSAEPTSRSPRIGPVASARDPAEADDMDRWFRQGLVAQRDALRSAHREAEEGGTRHIDSLRRLATSLARGIEERFPELADAARGCALLPSPRFLDAIPGLIVQVEREIAAIVDDPVRVLLVEDDATTVVLTKAILDAPGRRLLVAGSKAEAERLLALEPIDLVILDQSLPDADGRDLLVEMRARPATAGVPVIVVSGAEGPQPQTEGFALGADAYFCKPVHPSVLSSAAGAFLLRAAQIRDRALRDPLTGLRTRNVFVSSLTDAWTSLVRQGEPLTFALIDIDRFRALNDFHGRDIGDAVLRKVGTLISDTLRRSDLLARWADDAFALALPHTQIDEAQIAIRKVRSAMDAGAGIGDDPTPSVTCSVSLVALEAATNVEDGIAIAERRLAVAARGEGGRTVWSDDPTSIEGATVLLVEDDALTARLVQERLTRDGVTVIHVEDGLDALELTPSVHTSAIILDVSTPGADGFGLLKKLRESAAYATVPIMMLTQEREAQVSRAFSMGATDTLRKPFALSELSARVQRLVTGS